MSMETIAVLNQKGGSGKTTIATHLTRALQLDGADVLLVESDPQGSARNWAAVRLDHSLTVVGIDRPTIDRDIKNVARKVDYIVIDGAPQAAIVVSRAIKGTRIGGEVTGAITGYGLPVLETRITQRVSYPGAVAEGSTVLEQDPDGDAAKEIRALMNELKQKLI